VRCALPNVELFTIQTFTHLIFILFLIVFNFILIVYYRCIYMAVSDSY